MPSDPFDKLPPPNHKKFAGALKAHLRTALEALKRFSDSVRRGRYPEWPTEAELSGFIRQVNAFRLISKRGTKARPIHLIHEMDHRWPGMRIVTTLDNAVSNLESYVGSSLLAEANAKAIFERRSDAEHLRSLIFKKRNAEPADLQVMSDLLPSAFQVMIKLTSGKDLGSLSGVPPYTMSQLRKTLARAAQEYLIIYHQRFIAIQLLARPLREFIHQLKHPPYTKRLFGFSSDHIDLWNKIDRRKLTRARQQRFREKSAV